MENNTFTTTVYAQTPATRAFEYLRRLQNLDEWTLGSRMVTRIDDDTFMGTASGYQTMLCYHVRTLEHSRFAAIEWQCGYRYREYFKQIPGVRVSVAVCGPTAAMKTAATSTGSA